MMAATQRLNWASSCVHARERHTIVRAWTEGVGREGNNTHQGAAFAGKVLEHDCTGTVKHADASVSTVAEEPGYEVQQARTKEARPADVAQAVGQQREAALVRQAAAHTEPRQVVMAGVCTHTQGSTHLRRSGGSPGIAVETSTCVKMTEKTSENKPAWNSSSRSLPPQPGGAQRRTTRRTKCQPKPSPKGSLTIMRAA